MAELSTSGKKTAPRVDMTPMVDLMFLLVTFFILTTSISVPQAMDIAKPDKSIDHPEETLDLKASKTMTILIGKYNKVAWYMGVAGESTPTIENLAQIDGAISKNRTIADGSGIPGEFVVLIKPTSGASFKNFVDMMDQLEVLKVKVRQIDDDNINPAEKEAMKSQHIL